MISIYNKLKNYNKLFILYFTSSFMSKIMAMVIVSMIIRIGGTNIFVEMDYYINTSILLMPVIMLGLPDAAYDTIKKNPYKTNSIEIIGSYIIIIFLLWIIVVFCLDLHILLSLTGVLILEFGAAYTLKQKLRGLGKHFSYCLLDIFSYFVVIVCIVAFYFINSAVSSKFILFSYVIGYSPWLFFLKFRLEKEAFDYKLINDLLRYGLPIVPMGFVFGFISNSFRYFGTNTEIIFEQSLAFRIASVQVILNTIMYYLTQDKFYETYNEKINLIKFYIKNSRQYFYSFMIICILIIPLGLILTGDIISLKTILFTVGLSFAYMLFGICGTLSVYFNFKKKTHINLISSGVGFFFCILLYTISPINDPIVVINLSIFAILCSRIFFILKNMSQNEKIVMKHI